MTFSEWYDMNFVNIPVPIMDESFTREDLADAWDSALMDKKCAGEWSKIPPTHSGWYWWRINDNDPDVEVVQVYMSGMNQLYCDSQLLSKYGGKWWSIPVEEPS